MACDWLCWLYGSLVVLTVGCCWVEMCAGCVVADLCVVGLDVAVFLLADGVPVC